ncbi:MAG TPA: hypothetical protein VD887_01215 [Allosphingosinicella sp.]|nr:hypothetical protein [Allosphingosinicella sp.]
MAVADPLDDAVEDRHRLGLAAGAAKSRLGASEQGIQIELALGQQPFEIGVAGGQRRPRRGQVGEPGLRAESLRLGRGGRAREDESRRRGREKASAHLASEHVY